MALETSVLVVGAGPGGYVAAIKLAKLGKKVILVDKDKLGGECLNYGCIPSKALIHASWLAHKIRKSAAAGISAPAVDVDFPKLQSWKTGLVSGFNRGIAGLVKGNGATVLSGEVRFKSAHEAEIKSPAGAETVSFTDALIATGSRPMTLAGFEFDGDFVLSSKEALEQNCSPKNLVVIGGGVIGLEIGTFFAKLGSSVTVIEFMPTLLPEIDPDLVTPVARTLERLGVRVHLSSKARSHGPAPTGEDPSSVTFETTEGDKTALADKILVSVGRKPNTSGLGLAELGVALDHRGHIVVDASMRTTVPNLYAIGDAVGPPYLAHKASREGVLAAAAIVASPARERGVIPWAVFTDPEISFVGETEAQARARGVSVLVGKFPFLASGRAQATRESEGFVKVIADQSTHKILGAGIVGPHASDLISEAALAIKLGATVEDIAETVHPHPTLPEAFQEAAEACLGQAIHILSPSGTASR